MSATIEYTSEETAGAPLSVGSSLKQRVADVESGAYPEDKHLVHMPQDELQRFREGLDRA